MPLLLLLLLLLWCVWAVCMCPVLLVWLLARLCLLCAFAAVDLSEPLLTNRTWESIKHNHADELEDAFAKGEPTATFVRRSRGVFLLSTMMGRE